MTIQDGTTLQSAAGAALERTSTSPPSVRDHIGVRLIQGLAAALAVLFVLAAVRTAGADVDPEPDEAPLAAIEAG